MLWRRSEKTRSLRHPRTLALHKRRGDGEAWRGGEARTQRQPGSAWCRGNEVNRIIVKTWAVGDRVAQMVVERERHGDPIVRIKWMPAAPDSLSEVEQAEYRGGHAAAMRELDAIFAPKPERDPVSRRDP